MKIVILFTAFCLICSSILADDDLTPAGKLVRLSSARENVSYFTSHCSLHGKVTDFLFTRESEKMELYGVSSNDTSYSPMYNGIRNKGARLNSTVVYIESVEPLTEEEIKLWRERRPFSFWDLLSDNTIFERKPTVKLVGKAYFCPSDQHSTKKLGKKLLILP